jgi:hypothetical protein
VATENHISGPGIDVARAIRTKPRIGCTIRGGVVVEVGVVAVEQDG